MTSSERGSEPPGAARLRVIIADDEVLLRAGLARLLQDAGIEVRAQLSEATQIVESVREHQPDVAIIDVQMPMDSTDDGLRAAIAIRALNQGTGVLVVSNSLEERYPYDLIADDASGVGYLLKTRIGDVNSFINSVRRVAAGGSAIDPEVVARMVGRHRVNHPIDTLTQRERAVLGLMAEGYSNHGVSAALGVTPAAVEKHITAVFSKLGLVNQPSHHRRVVAVLQMLRASF